MTTVRAAGCYLMDMIDPALWASERLRPLKRSEYDRLVELGCFDDEKIELLNGMLVPVSPQGAEHSHAVRTLTTLFVRGVGDRALVQCQLPLGASDDSEPEPDITVVASGDYSREHPTRALFIAEVSNSSLRKDRQLKAALYARAGVPEYWIDNIVEQVVEIQRVPESGEYKSVTTHGTGQVIHPEAFADLKIAVASLFPQTG
jgi:Uma2 family endonuclease